MSGHVIGAHNGLHSELGALRGEHPGRSANPVIKVQDVGWLEFEKPDLARTMTLTVTHAVDDGRTMRAA